MTYAEQAAKRLEDFAEGFAGDWWGECIEGDGYDDDATDHVDQETSSVALYVDGSYITFDGEHAQAQQATTGSGVERVADGPAAVWMGDHWMLTEATA
jgi:hypothetical protein